MSDIIRLLPDSVANQIAAGEVIQRPASVVKELVENAVDAKATKVSVIIKDAGRTLIQIIDNGIGMSATDARLAFERHSTSKITSADDLFALRTMGFRGEALASIAAVSQVEMKTMRQDDSIGTHLFINASEVESQSATATVPGTNMMIKNLFFNVPARRKFLKKDAIEFNNILHEFERLALVNPDVELSLIHNGIVIHQLPKQNLKQRIGGLFGSSIEGKIIPIETDTSIVKIKGFIGLPQNAKKRGALQYLFVNGRNMRHLYFHKAILSCYEQLIRADEQPSYFVDFQVDPATIDVNIHPTKNEIKFEYEQHIRQILVAAVKESLGKFNAVPSIDFDSAVEMPELPAFNPSKTAGIPFIDYDNDYNPFNENGQNSEKANLNGQKQWQHSAKKPMADWDKLYDQFMTSGNDNANINQFQNDFRSDSAPIDNTPAHLDLDNGNEVIDAKNTLIQLKNKYILTQNRRGLLIIDQHRAHVKILYEDILHRIKNESYPTQMLIFPEMTEFLPGESNCLEGIKDQIANFGFDISYLGDNTWSINGIPGIEKIENPVELLKEIVSSVLEEETGVKEKIDERIASGIAHAGAIKAGQHLSETEMEHLVSRLFSLPSPNYTSEGLPVFTEISESYIDNLF